MNECTVQVVLVTHDAFVTALVVRIKNQIKRIVHQINQYQIRKIVHKITQYQKHRIVR